MSLPRRTLVARPIFSGQDATIARICASSAAVSSRGNLNNTMCCRLIGPSSSLGDGSRSVELEVLAHLPVADLLTLRRRVLGHGRLVPGQLRALHLQQVVDEHVA